MLIDAGRRCPSRTPAGRRRSARRQLGPARPHRRPAAVPGARGRRLARRSRRVVCARRRVSRRRRQVARRGSPSSRSTAARVASAFDDVERVALVASREAVVRVARTGNKKNWRDIDPVRERIERLGDGARRDGERRGSTPQSSMWSSRSARCTTAGVEARRAAGELEFHDLLVLARTLLRDPEHGARARAPAARPLPAHPDRRVPGHRSDPGRARGAARIRRPTTPATATVERDRGRARPACSSSAIRSSRSTGSGGPTSRRSSMPRDALRDRAPRVPHVQFPDAHPSARLDQSRVRPS